MINDRNVNRLILIQKHQKFAQNVSSLGLGLEDSYCNSHCDDLISLATPTMSVKRLKIQGFCKFVEAKALGTPMVTF